MLEAWGSERRVASGAEWERRSEWGSEWGGMGKRVGRSGAEWGMQSQ
jgi:hypothetical protein